MSLLLALIAAQAAAQPPPILPVPRPGVPVAPMIVPNVWNPAAEYISAGQDEPGYRSWYLAAPWRAAQVKSFNDFLVTNQVGGILPTWQVIWTAGAGRGAG